MISRRGFMTGVAGVAGAGLMASSPWAAARANATGVFDDVGLLDAGECATPGVLHVSGSTVCVIASRRYPNPVPGGNVETGPADIITFRSTDSGATWGPARVLHTAATAPASEAAGAAPVLTMIGSDLVAFYMVAAQNYTMASRMPRMRVSSDGGDTWGPVTVPTVTSAHIHGQPTNGGKGFQFPNGRVVIPGRGCLLYSDDGGASWTATPQFTGLVGGDPAVEVKTVPYFISGAISKTALVPWRNHNVNLGEQQRVRIADVYADNGTVSSPTGGANNNFGLARYDAQTLLMSYTTVSNQTLPSSLYVRLSLDEGRNWTAGKRIPKATTTTRYSDLDVTDDGMITVAYIENSPTTTNGHALSTVRFDLDWLQS